MFLLLIDLLSRARGYVVGVWIYVVEPQLLYSSFIDEEDYLSNMHMLSSLHYSIGVATTISYYFIAEVYVKYGGCLQKC